MGPVAKGKAVGVNLAWAQAAALIDQADEIVRRARATRIKSRLATANSKAKRIVKKLSKKR